MVSKIKNFFSRTVFKKEWLAPLLLISIFLEVLIPLSFIEAQFGFLGGLADAVGKAIGAIIAGFLTAIPAAIFGISALILQWSIDPAFIKVPSYTSGAIVDIGWPIMRDLANMGIVLALVIIGLATALRLEEYQARRTLPRLIFVALLINFTPVILGFIVDFTNIVMYFFLDGLMGIESVTTVFAAIHSVVASDLSGFNFFAPLALMSFIFKIMIIWIFYIVAAIIFLLFAVLFIMRRIAIWMLVIFSPIAFVAWVLPATRRLWSMWWGQFIQWSIIGIFAAFFLYLGDHMIGLAASGVFTGDAPGGFGGWITRPVTTVLEQMMPYVIALIFLLFGFFIALTTSAFGSSGVINLAKRGTKAAGATAAAWAGTRAATYAKEKWQKSPTAERMSRRLSEAQAPEEVKIFGRKVPVVSQVAKWGAAASVVGVRAVGRAGISAREMGPTDVGKEMEEAKKRGVEMKTSHLLSPEKTKTQRGATYLAAAEQGQLKPLEAMLEARLGKEKKEAMIEKLGKEAMEIHPEVFKRFEKARLDIADKIAPGFSKERREAAGWGDLTEEEREQYGTILNKKMVGMKPEEIAKMAPSVLEVTEIKEAMHLFWGGSQISASGRAFGLEFIDTFNKEMRRRGVSWYKDNNPKVLRYLSATPARELGFLSEDEIGPGTERGPGRPPSPPPSPSGGPPPEEEQPPRGRPGPGIGPMRPPRGRPGPGVSEERMEEIIKEEVERRRQRGEEELRKRGWPRGRPGIGV